MSSDFPREGLLAFCALPAELLDALKALEDVTRSMTAWIQSVVPPIDGVRELLNRAMDGLPSSNAFTRHELGVTPAESGSRTLCLSGRSVYKKALKSNTKAVHFRGLWLKGPEDQFMLATIKKLLKDALYASDIWEAMEYLMAARGLLRVQTKRK